MKQRRVGTLLLLEKSGFDRESVHLKPAGSRHVWRQRKAGPRRLRATIARMRRQATFATSQKFTSMHARFVPPHRWVEEKSKIAEHKPKGRGQHPPSFHLPPPAPPTSMLDACECPRPCRPDQRISIDVPFGWGPRFGQPRRRLTETHLCNIEVGGEGVANVRAA